MASERALTVFLAHSSEDTGGRTFFDRMFSAAGVRAYWYPYPAGRTYPHYVGILKAIAQAESVFVVLSKPMETKPHTRSWVSFEVGIATGLGKNVWVFEHPGETVDIPVPGATGYLQRPETTNSLETYVFGDLVKSAGTRFPRPAGDVWFYAVCGNPECREEFLTYLVDPKTAACPACRRSATITPMPADEQERRRQEPRGPAALKLGGHSPFRPVGADYVELGPQQNPTRVPVGIWIERDDDEARFRHLARLALPRYSKSSGWAADFTMFGQAIRFLKPRVPAAAFSVQIRWRRMGSQEVETIDVLRPGLIPDG